MSFELPGLIYGMIPAGADLSTKQFYGVKVNTSGLLVLCDTADERVDGILQNKPNASGAEASILKDGISKCVAASAITKGDLVAITAAGKVATAPAKRILTNTATLDFSSVNSGLTADLTITVTGAAANDAVLIGPPTTLDAGISVSGFVSASNTVTVRIANNTAGAVDVASSTWRATVIKPMGYLVGRALETVTADGQIVAVDLGLLGMGNV